MLKSNRALAAVLMDAGLVSLNDLDSANEVFIQHVRRKDLLRASLLRVLIFEKQSLVESNYLNYLFDQSYAGILLDSYHVQETVFRLYAPELMMATWSLPVDRVGDTTFIVSAYLVSEPVQAFWKDQVDGPIIWYATPLADLEQFFTRAFEDFINAKEQE